MQNSAALLAPRERVTENLGKDAPMLANTTLASTKTAIVLTLGVTLLLGCSDSQPGGVSVNSEMQAVGSSTNVGGNAVPSDPAAATAYAFLDAVFAGDTDRADQQLTPAAAQQLAASGQRFAPPGAGPTSFAIGEVLHLSDDRAAVECLVRGELDGQSAEESLGCLLRKVEGRWGVSGIAYEVSPGEPPTVFDFERISPEQQPDFVATPPASGPSPAGARTAVQPSENLAR